MKYECPCGYVYDPELGDPDSGIAPGTAWEDIPDDLGELSLTDEMIANFKIPIDN